MIRLGMDSVSASASASVTVAVAVLASLAMVGCVLAATPHDDGITTVSLDGTWKVLLDPFDRGLDGAVDGGQGGSVAGTLADPDHGAWSEAIAVSVPGALETTEATVGYDGVAFYRTTLPALSPTEPGGRVLLDFTSVNYRADVWLEDVHLGRHDGSDAPFRFDVTGQLDEPGKRLVVRVVDPGDKDVDGLVLGALPHAKESWYLNYGGITGSVTLTAAPRVELLGHDVVFAPGQPLELKFDLQNHTAAPLEITIGGELIAAVGDDGEPAVPPASWSSRFELPPGFSRIGFGAVDSVDDWPRWSPDEPALHSMLVRIDDDGRVQEHKRRFGLRTFEVVGDHFELNGEPTYIKGVLYQPYFPKTLVHPPTPDFLRDELLAIKAAGFNLVRVHLRTIPAINVLCDEIGLMVLAEPTLGWITVMRPETRPAVHKAIAALAQDVAGHPSVVMVCLLNELSGWLYRDAPELMAGARKLMPNQLILEDSGSWQGTSHYINPRADSDAEPVEFDDLHIYRSWPWNEGDRKYIESLGVDNDRLVFVSEYGYGGIATFDRNLAGFGDELFYEDAQVYAAQKAEAVAAQQPGREDIFEGLDELVALGLANQAAAARFMASALRSNPRVAGDVYTQWRDVMWEDGAGLVDVWGGPKPAYEAMAELNAAADRPDNPFEAERAPLVAPEAAYWPNRDVERIPAGGGDMVAVEPELEALLSEALLPPDEWAEFISSDEWPEYTVDPDRRPGIESRRLWFPMIAVVGFRANMWGPDEIDETISLLRWVWNGGMLLMLGPPDAGRPLGVDLFGYDTFGVVADLPFEARSLPSRGHFVGRHLIFSQSAATVLGLGGNRLFDDRFRQLRPNRVLQVGDEDWPELINVDGYGQEVGSAIQLVRFGEGAMVISTLPIEPELLDDPVTRRVLKLLVNFSTERATLSIFPGWGFNPQSDPKLPPDRQPVAVPAEAAETIGRLMWRHRIYFGLAERLAWQDFNGSRPERREPDELADVIANKNEALLAIIQGDYDSGIELLSRIETEDVIDDARDAFIRQEVRIAKAWAAIGGSPELPVRLRVSELHGRAAQAFRDDDVIRATETLDRLEELVASLPPNPEIEALEAEAEDADLNEP